MYCVTLVLSLTLSYLVASLRRQMSLCLAGTFLEKQRRKGDSVREAGKANSNVSMGLLNRWE